ncbi:MAG: 3D domain-containing protein [Deltaproteobacteria bacterium]|nr:3D domain-containing protein [Deltaproteobacteria bacterium]
MKKSLLLAIGIAGAFLWMGNGAVVLEPIACITAVSAALSGKEVVSIEKKPAGMHREVTAYNVGVRAQTSDTPCIGAGGHDLCELVERNVKVCAANFVPLGTILEIEGHGEFVVLDRLHKRFAHRVDIAMKEGELMKALTFGLQKRLVAVKD